MVVEQNQSSAGAVLCMMKDSEPNILIMLQNSSFYKRKSGGAVIDIGPKGQVREGESYEAAAVREVKEETGLDVLLEKGFEEELRYQYETVDGSKPRTVQKTVRYFLAFVSQDDIGRIRMSDEHLGCRMVKLDDAIKEIGHPEQKALLGRLSQYLKGGNSR